MPRHGRIRTVDYATLIPGAPAADDLCYATFGFLATPPERPWPPPPQPDGSPTLPPQFPCLSQRAAVNVTPAINRDGTIFTVTRAHSFAANDYAFIVALRPNLKLKWAPRCASCSTTAAGCRWRRSEPLTAAMERAGVVRHHLRRRQASDIGPALRAPRLNEGPHGAFTGTTASGSPVQLDRRPLRLDFDFGWSSSGIYRTTTPSRS